MIDINGPVRESDIVDMEDLTLAEIAERFREFAGRHGVQVGDVKLSFGPDFAEIVCLRPPTQKEVTSRRRAQNRLRRIAEKTSL